MAMSDPDAGEQLNVLVGGVFQLLLTGGDIRAQSAPLHDGLAAILAGPPPHSAAARVLQTADLLLRERRSRVRHVLLRLLELMLETLAGLGVVPEPVPFLPGAGSPLPAGLNLQGDKDDAQLLGLLCRVSGPIAEPLCRRALSDGNEFLVLRALDCLPEVIPDEVEDLLREALSHASRKVKTAAAKSLAALVGPEVGQLVEHLQDPDERVRVAAAKALANLRYRARDAVPALIEALEDKPAVRQAAVLALTAIGPLARDAGPALCDLLAQERNQARRVTEIAALEAVDVEPGLLLRTLLGLLNQPNANLHAPVLAALGVLGPDAGPAARPLWDMFEQGTYLQGPGLLAFVIGQIGPGAAELALDLLTALGPEVAEPSFASTVFAGLAPYLNLSPFLHHLDRLLRGPGQSVVPGMLTTGIARAGPDAGRRHPTLGDLVPALCRLALRQGTYVNCEIRDALEVCDPSGQRTVAELSRHLSPDNYEVAQCILLTICRYAGGVWSEGLFRPPLRRTGLYALLPVLWNGPGIEEARQLLATMLTHRTPGILVRAAERLGKLGPAGRPYVPALEGLLARRGDSWEARLEAARALFRITGEQGPARAVVLERLRQPPAYGNGSDLDVLWEMGPTPDDAALLRPLLGDQYLGFAAAGLLGNLDPEDEVALALLDRSLDPSPSAVDHQAAWTLRRFRTVTPRVLALLKQALSGPIAGVAAETVGLLGAQVEELLPDLVRMLADESMAIYRPAAVALLRLGQHTDAALAALSASVFDKPEPTDRPMSGPALTPFAFPHLLVELDEQPGETHRVLADAVRNADGPARFLAAINLARWGECVPETVPVLAEAIQDDPPDGRSLLRAQAARTLGELGQAALPVLPEMQAVLPALRSWVLRGEVHRAIARLRLLG